MSTQAAQGPPQPRKDPDELRSKYKAALWSAVWEASQLLSYDEIREHVERTIAEIVSDEP